MTQANAKERKPKRGFASLIWALLAVLTASGTYVMASSPRGEQRIASLVERVRTSLDKADEIVVYQQDNSGLKDDLNKVVGEVQQANSENMALKTRLARLEEALGPVTASVDMAVAPEETAALPPAKAENESIPTANKTPKAKRVRTIALPPGTGPDTGPDTADDEYSSPLVSSTLFGLELATTLTLSDGKVVWRDILLRHPDILGALSPRIAIAETDGGRIELRVVAGPVRNAAKAASLCAHLRAAGQPCRSTLYEGQTLALR